MSREAPAGCSPPSLVSLRASISVTEGGGFAEECRSQARPWAGVHAHSLPPEIPRGEGEGCSRS